ncbi:CASP-like protein 1c1, partial [Phtheirospermum japonicum]
YRYCLIVDFIGCLYNLLVVFLPAGSQLWKTVIVIDVIMNIAVGASLGIGWEINRLIRGGYLAARWYPICAVVPFFCGKVFGSLIPATVGFACSFSLLMYTLHVLADPFLIEK